MNLAFNNLQRMIYYKTQTNKQTTVGFTQVKVLFSDPSER